MNIFIKNYGNSTAINIIFHGVVDFSPISIDTRNSWGESPHRFSLAPKEIMSLRQILTPEEYKEGHGGKGLFFGISVQYTFEGSKIGSFTLVGSINEIDGSGMLYHKKEII